MNLAVAAAAVFAGFGVMSLAGLGAATLFIPIFYYTGTPLPEAISTGLLLNVVALGVAAPGHLRARSVNLRLGIPILVLAAALAPLGAAVSNAVNRELLLGLFAGFLVISGGLMLRGRRPQRSWTVSRLVEVGTGAAVGGGVGFLAGLLGVGGGDVDLEHVRFPGADRGDERRARDDGEGWQDGGSCPHRRRSSWWTCSTMVQRLGCRSKS